jgi:prolyl-tRNA synthetase
MRLAEAGELGGFVKGYIGPQGQAVNGVRVIADPLVRSRGSWASGANKDGHHVVGLRLGTDFTVDSFEDLVVVRDGDPSPRCDGSLSLVRSVEVGHTFQLGLAYSAILPHARFSSAQGEELPYWMGCYGIGVTRVPAVIAQQYCSEDGDAITWPVEVAPFVVTIIGVGASQSNGVVSVAVQLYEEMREQGISVLLEDRNVSTGVAMRDLELIGSPVFCIVGARSVAKGEVEIRDRMRDSTLQVSISEAASTVVTLLDELAIVRR